jgi:putative FmdB family regulatory protein
MPIYEYKCTWCGNVVERYDKTCHDRKHIRVPCDPCGDIWSERVHERIMSTNSFKLKGMGWAVDGYDKNAKPRIVELDEPSVI